MTKSTPTPVKWFPAELRTASVVPRWSIVWTLTRDTLSNHSFFTAIYANQIAQMIEWQGPRGPLLLKAIGHDFDETITGDIVAPAKRHIVDQPRATAYVQEQMKLRLTSFVEQFAQIDAEWPVISVQINQIVKAADRLDALLFLTIEQRMGNGVVGPLIPSVTASLKQAWFLLPAEPRRLSELWEEVQAAVAEHATSGGFGI